MATITAPATLTLELNVLEAFQLEAALQKRLALAGKAEVRVDAGSFEADVIADEIRWTGSALAKLQLLLYGEAEPDEPVWLAGPGGLPTVLVGWTESELREAWGGK